MLALRPRHPSRACLRLPLGEAVLLPEFLPVTEPSVWRGGRLPSVWRGGRLLGLWLWLDQGEFSPHTFPWTCDRVLQTPTLPFPLNSMHFVIFPGNALPMTWTICSPARRESRPCSATASPGPEPGHLLRRKVTRDGWPPQGPRDSISPP